MKLGKTEIVVVIILFGVIALVGWYAFQKSVEDAQLSSDAGKALLMTDDSKHIYTDLNGNLVSFDSYSNKARVVNSWATWCPFCVSELPDLSEVAASFSQDEIVFITINRGENPEKVKSFIKRVSANESLIHVLNPNDTFYKVIGGFSMPETIFYDAEGNIAFHKRGVMTKEEIMKRTESLLDQSTPE